MKQFPFTGFLYQIDNRGTYHRSRNHAGRAFAEAFGMNRRILLQSYVSQVAEEYGGDRIAAQETKRAIQNEAELDHYRELFFDLPHLEVRLEDMNMSFDPRTLIPLDEDEGTITPAWKSAITGVFSRSPMAEHSCAPIGDGSLSPSPLKLRATW